MSESRSEFRSRRGQNFFWGLFVLLLMPAILAILFFPDLISRSQFSSPYSTFRSDPQGSKALFLFSQETDYAPQRITRPVNQDLAPGLLFSLAPANFSHREIDDTLRWIMRGGTYVLATDRPHHLLNAFRIELSWEKRHRDRGEALFPPRTGPELYPEPAPDPQDRNFLRRKGPNPLTDGLNLHFDPSSPSLFSGLGSALSLFEDQNGPLILLMRYGKGQLIVLGDPRFFGNQNLANGDNLLFLSRLMYEYGSENLYFDEYHHGFSHELSIPGYLWKRHFQFFLVQLFLVIVSWIYLQRKVWGERRTPAVSCLRPSSDSIRAMARIYQRVSLSPETMQWLFEALVPASSARGGHRAGPDAERRRTELEQDLARLTSGKRKIQAAEAVRFAQKIVMYRKEVYGRAAEHQSYSQPQTGH
ncbi:MAG: DUF4350 domain-containing protein [bacterium]